MKVRRFFGRVGQAGVFFVDEVRELFGLVVGEIKYSLYKDKLRFLVAVVANVAVAALIAVVLAQPSSFMRLFVMPLPGWVGGAMLAFLYVVARLLLWFTSTNRPQRTIQDIEEDAAIQRYKTLKRYRSDLPPDEPPLDDLFQ